MSLSGNDVSVYCLTDLGREGQQLALMLQVYVCVSHVSLIKMRRHFDRTVELFEDGRWCCITTSQLHKEVAGRRGYEVDVHIPVGLVETNNYTAEQAGSLGWEGLTVL